MATLKSQVSDISRDTESLVKEYVKLFSLKQSEKLALFLGIIASVFLLATLLLIVVVFASFAFAGYLNKVLAGEYWGYVIVGGAYILTIILLIVKIFRTKTPLLGNFFARLIVTVLDLETDDVKDLQGLKDASELTRQKIDVNQIKIKGNIQLLRYTIFEALFKEFIGLFKTRKKEKDKEKDKKKE
jgi:energy-coupling factor transporter transmembrane protein EcfT